MQIGSIPRDLVWRVKAATRDLIKRAGTIERAAEITGLSTSQLHRCGSNSSEHESSILPLLAVFLLEADVGRPIVTEVMAAATGSDVTREEGEYTSGPVPVDFTETLGAVAGLCSETARALEDGVVSGTEALRICEAVVKATDKIEALQRAAAAAVAKSRARVVDIRKA